MDFSRYNNNLNDLKKDIEAAEENSKKFEEIIPGTYEISIESLAVKETKSGDSLMLSARMKILDGKYKNRDNQMNKSKPHMFGHISKLTNKVCFIYITMDKFKL